MIKHKHLELMRLKRCLNDAQVVLSIAKQNDDHQMIQNTQEEIEVLLGEIDDTLGCLVEEKEIMLCQ